MSGSSSIQRSALISLLWISPLLIVCALFAIRRIGTSWFGLMSAEAMTLLLFMALQLIPLLWRAQYPLQAFTAVSVSAFVQWVLGVEPTPANIAVVVAMFAVCRLCELSWAMAAGLVTVLGAVMANSRWEFSSPVADLSSLVWFDVNYPYGVVPSPSLSPVLLGIVAVWLGGIYAHTRRRYLESIEERAQRAERERDQQALIGAAAERSRIARELHDVVAHKVSVMVVHAEGGRLALHRSDEDQVRHALDTIWSTGRESLAELRRLLGVLREGTGGDVGQQYAPQPGIDQIGALVSQMQASGLPVTLAVSGAPKPMSPGFELTVYRVVQESLTNVLRHAGAGTPCRVRLTYGPTTVDVEVEDDGTGAIPKPGSGHGLLGMRERVAVHGGSVEAGPRTGGGFRVAVRLPYEATQHQADVRAVG